MGKSNKITDTLETTLAIIKPDGIINRREIIRKILKAGFFILYNKKFQLSPEQAADFLKNREQDKNFSILVYSFSSGPIEILILSKENAINDFLILLGPERPIQAKSFCPGTIRAEFGDFNDDFRNAVHGSLNMYDARREIHFFHPNFIYEYVGRVKPEAICCYRNIIGPLMEGLQNFTKQRPYEPNTWLSQWLYENNKNFPIITEAGQCKSDQTIEEPKSCSPVCSSLRDDSISSLLNSIMSSSSITGSSSVICQKNVISSSTQAGSSETVICCENNKHDPHVCPNCEKLIKVPIPKMGRDFKKHCQIKLPHHSGESTLSTGSSTNPTVVCNIPSTSSSSVIKHL